MKLRLSIICSLLFAPAVALFAVELAETPSTVQQTIHAQIGDGHLGGIDRTNQDGEASYDIDYTNKAGDELDFSVAEDGTLLSVEVALAETPAAVQATIQSEAPGWELEGIDKNVAETEVTYDVDVSQGDAERTFTVDADGTLSGRGVSLAETPAEVRQSIEARAGATPVKSVEQLLDAAGNTYEARVAPADGGEMSFCVSTNGTLVSEGVPLEKVTPAARKTIKDRIGDGKILQINKSLLEKKDGVLPYEVLGRKDGKSFDFSVGPHGRFLGMDD